MMIETTVMRYVNGTACVIGIILNESVLECWVGSLHISNVLEQSLLGLKGNDTNKDVTHYTKKSKARMNIDSIDRNKLRKYLVTYIALFYVDVDPLGIVHIHSGKFSTKEINVYLCKTVGEKQ